MEYLITEWVLDSDGTPHVCVSSYKTYEGALEKYTTEKNKILQLSTDRKYNLLLLDTEEKYEHYCDNIDEYQCYVIEQICYDILLAFFQDFGWKRPRGVSLKSINKNDQNDLNWVTKLTCYPIRHGGQW